MYAGPSGDQRFSLRRSISRVLASRVWAIVKFRIKNLDQGLHNIVKTELTPESTLRRQLPSRLPPAPSRPPPRNRLKIYLVLKNNLMSKDLDWWTFQFFFYELKRFIKFLSTSLNKLFQAGCHHSLPVKPHTIRHLANYCRRWHLFKCYRGVNSIYQVWTGPKHFPPRIVFRNSFQGATEQLSFPKRSLPNLQLFVFTGSQELEVSNLPKL